MTLKTDQIRAMVNHYENDSAEPHIESTPSAAEDEVEIESESQMGSGPGSEFGSKSGVENTSVNIPLQF